MNPTPRPDLPADAVAAATHLDRLAAALEASGRGPDITLAALAICRDELTQPLVGEVADRWGTPFALSGLGGLPALGTTGWKACLSHVPETGRGHLLVIALPHIGVTADGTVGASVRRAQDHPTASCGALSGLLSLVTGDGGRTEGSGDGHADGTGPVGLLDAEFDRLSLAVQSELEGPPADLLDLTLAAASAVSREIWADLEALSPWDTMDATVATGIQVHVDGEDDRLLPLGARTRTADGYEELVIGD